LTFGRTIEYARSIVGIKKINYKKIFTRYGCVKKKSWSFQEEMRIFSFKRSKEIDYYSDWSFAPNDLKVIYFGYKADYSAPKSQDNENGIFVVCSSSDLF
jgi:hypothetical protein